jgi:hypothetical protein
MASFEARHMILNSNTMVARAQLPNVAVKPQDPSTWSGSRMEDGNR